MHVLTLLCNKILRNVSGNHFIPFDRTNFTNACRLAASLELARKNNLANVNAKPDKHNIWAIINFMRGVSYTC